MDHIVPTPQRRLRCGISITPQEMVLCTAACTNRRESFHSLLPRAPAPGIKEIWALKKKCPLCIWNSAVLTQRLALSRWNIYRPHPCPGQLAVAEGTGQPGLLVPGGSTPACPKWYSSITNTNVPAGCCSELNHLQGSLIAVLSSFQLRSDKSVSYRERFGRGTRRVKNNRGSIIPLYPHSP